MTENNNNSAVVFDWSGTFARSDYSVRPSVERAIDGASELIAKLRDQGHSVYLINSGLFNPEMLNVGFQSGEILASRQGEKADKIDDLRAAGFEKLVFVSRNVSDVEQCATKYVPVVIFNPAKTPANIEEEFMRMLESDREEILNTIDGSDVTIALGIEQLEAVLDEAIQRSCLRSRNKTQARAFTDKSYAESIARRFAKELRDDQIPAIEASSQGINVPDERCVRVGVEPLPDNDRFRSAFKIVFDYPIEIPERTISSVLQRFNSEYRSQGSIPAVGGLNWFSSLPDKARPQQGFTRS